MRFVDILNWSRFKECRVKFLKQIHISKLFTRTICYFNDLHKHPTENNY